MASESENGPATYGYRWSDGSIRPEQEPNTHGTRVRLYGVLTALGKPAQPSVTQATLDKAYADWLKEYTRWKADYAAWEAKYGKR